MTDREELLRLREIVSNIYMNARIIPDPAMGGTTDCYSVPCDDIEAIQEFREEKEVAQMRALYEGEKAAGLHKPREEYERDLIDAGRGHLLRR